MKVAIYIFILLASTSIYACDNSPSDVCNTVQFQYNDFSHTEADDCRSELCFCNCCNQASILSLIIDQNICENNSTPTIYHSFQNLSGYSSSHWQPPKI
jgi:hypothetical protein